MIQVTPEVLDILETVPLNFNRSVNCRYPINGYIITDNMALVSDKLVDGISGLIRNLFSRKKGKEESIDE